MKRLAALFVFLFVAAKAFPFLLGGLVTNPGVVGAPANDPSTVAPLRQWIRTSDSINYNGANLISQYTDRSGNGFNCTQTVDGNKALRLPSDTNGKDAALFDRVALQYADCPGAVLDLTQPWTISTVLRQGTNGFYPTIWSLPGVSKAVILINDDNAAAGTRLDFGNSDFYFSLTAPGTGVTYSVTLQFAGGSTTTLSNYSGFINRTPMTLNQSHSLGNSTNNSMLAGFISSNYTWDGKFFERDIYQQKLDSTQLGMLWDYNTSQWGLP